MTRIDVAQQPLATLLEDLASRAPTPGGGCATAVAGALGASLVAMLARASKDRPESASHAKLLEAVAEAADEARDRLLRLAADDAEAYGKVIEVGRLPAKTEEERAAKQKALTDALKGASEVPLRVMEQILEVIGLAKNAVETGIQSAATDGATGAEICRAALKSAALQVKANLAHIDDETYVKLARTRMDEMAYMGTRVCTHIESFVEDLLGPGRP